MSQEEIDIQSQRVVTPSRREFVKHTVVAAVAALAPVSIVHPENSRCKPKPSAGAHIKSVVMREDTVVRHGGNGDIFPLTWTSSDRQFCSFSDGSGFSDVPKIGYNTQAIWVDGGPLKVSFQELAGFPAYTFHCPPQKVVGKHVGKAAAVYGRDPDGNSFELLELYA